MIYDMAAPGFERIVSKNADLEKVADGFIFTEGPVWNHREGHLRFSDIPANRIHQWSPGDGLSVYREPTQKSNGLTYDRQGRLIACEHLGRRVSRTEADGTVTAAASHHQGKKLNSPNDVVVKSDGSIYFTDPNYGIIEGRVGEAAPQEQDALAVYRVSPDGSAVTRVTAELSKPNGLAFSPDESLLYIDDTEQGNIRVYDVLPDGLLANGRIFATVSGDGTGRPDGMKVDVEGNVYCTGPGGVHVLAPDGSLLGRLRIPATTANLAWGGDGWNTLFLTASDTVYSLKVNATGVAVG